MGKLDKETKVYFRNRERFADVFNYKLYDGRQIIRPEDLKPFDSSETVVAFGNNKRKQVSRIRDNTNIWAAMQDGHTAYIILGLESQERIHYAMPVRNMLYDSMNYTEQVRNIADSIHAKKTEGGAAARGLTGAEYLSGFRKEDRLMPVITLVVYFGTEPWDVPDPSVK